MDFDDADTMPFHRNWAHDDELSLHDMDDWFWSAEEEPQLPADLA